MESEIESGAHITISTHRGKHQQDYMAALPMQIKKIREYENQKRALDLL